LETHWAFRPTLADGLVVSSIKSHIIAGHYVPVTFRKFLITSLLAENFGLSVRKFDNLVFFGKFINVVLKFIRKQLVS
jgi:hypothetical protein